MALHEPKLWFMSFLPPVLAHLNRSENSWTNLGDVLQRVNLDQTQNEFIIQKTSRRVSEVSVLIRWTFLPLNSKFCDESRAPDVFAQKFSFLIPSKSNFTTDQLA